MSLRGLSFRTKQSQTNNQSSIIHNQFYYSYDAYGVMLGTDDTAAENAATSLLYAGEQYDSELDHYYLRARYYNPYSGTFNRTDPFAGNNSDPQSLHKYLYCHNNPINAIDPSGLEITWRLATLLTGFVILLAIVVGLVAYRIGMMSSGARGSKVYVDFSNFNLSGIKFENGSKPDEEIVKERVLKKMNQAYFDADVSVRELTDQTTTRKTPVLSFGEWGQNEGGETIVGECRPRVNLAPFKIDLNGRFENNEQLAHVIALSANHEVGHSYKLDDLYGNQYYNNIMRRVIAVGTGPKGEITPDDVLRGYLNYSSFNGNQIEIIKNVALAGRKG